MAQSRRGTIERRSTMRSPIRPYRSAVAHVPCWCCVVSLPVACIRGRRAPPRRRRSATRRASGHEHVRAGARLAGAARRAARQGDPALVDEHDLSRHRSRLLGVRAGGVRRRDARLRDGLPGRWGIREAGRRVARPRGVRQLDPQEGDAGHHRHLRQPRRGAGAERCSAAAVQSQRRVRQRDRSLRALPARGDHSGSCADVQPAH